jgi:predicted metalloprotease
MPLPTGFELRAARCLIGWEAQRLASAAGVNPATISRMEKCGQKPIRGLAETVERVQTALRNAGVVIEPDAIRRVRKPRR